MTWIAEGLTGPLGDLDDLSDGSWRNGRDRHYQYAVKGQEGQDDFWPSIRGALETGCRGRGTRLEEPPNQKCVDYMLPAVNPVFLMIPADMTDYSDASFCCFTS